jgi:hypothetical protein
MAEVKEKQPSEVVDIDLDWSEVLTDGDEIDFVDSLTAETGLTLGEVPMNPPYVILAGKKVVKVWVSGGTNGARYKVTLVVRTDNGRRFEHEFFVLVRET